MSDDFRWYANMCKCLLQGQVSVGDVMMRFWCTGDLSRVSAGSGGVTLLPRLGWVRRVCKVFCKID